MALRVLGVPTAAGAYGGGVMRGPAALRGAGLRERLAGASLTVVDAGDLPTRPFAADPTNPRAQNLDRVVGVARAVADRVSDITASGDLPVVLGGDCTITLGVISGLVRSRPGIALAYIDGDADLATPSTTRSGILDAMGVATMLGLAGAPPELADLAGRSPMLSGERLALIGYDDTELDAAGRESLRVHRVRQIAGKVLADDPSTGVRRVLDALADHDGLIVHFDVDVIDSTELPLAQYPHFNQGLTSSAAFESLATACSFPEVAAVVITETNPDNDPHGTYVRRLVDGIASALGNLAPDPLGRS